MFELAWPCHAKTYPLKGCPLPASCSFHKRKRSIKIVWYTLFILKEINILTATDPRCNQLACQWKAFITFSFSILTAPSIIIDNRQTWNTRKLLSLLRRTIIKAVTSILDFRGRIEIHLRINFLEAFRELTFRHLTFIFQNLNKPWILIN